MKLVERVAIGVVTVLLGGSIARAQGWVPLVNPYGGGMTAAAPYATYAAAYAPAVPYRPAVTVNYLRPTLAYSPVSAPVYPAAYAVQPVAAGPRVWVKPKVYVEGQPLRNLLRAITP